MINQAKPLLNKEASFQMVRKSDSFQHTNLAFLHLSNDEAESPQTLALPDNDEDSDDSSFDADN